MRRLADREAHRVGHREPDSAGIVGAEAGGEDHCAEPAHVELHPGTSARNGGGSGQSDYGRAEQRMFPTRVLTADRSTNTEALSAYGGLVVQRSPGDIFLGGVPRLLWQCDSRR